MNAAEQKKKMDEMLAKLNKENQAFKKELGMADSDGEDGEMANLAKQINKIVIHYHSIHYIQMPENRMMKK